MKVKTIGIDWATAPSKVGLALGIYDGVVMRVCDSCLGSKNDTPLDIVLSWLRTDPLPTLFAVDAPLGWPHSLGVAISEHKAGSFISTSPDQLFFRTTDRCVQKKIGQRPLAVGADRIALTAHSALQFLHDLRNRLQLSIPLIWDTSVGAEHGVIEVYPAATLVAHGIDINGYKAAGDFRQRTAIDNRLSEGHLDFNTEIAGLEKTSDGLDAVVCLLAAKDFLTEKANPPEDLSLAQKEGWIWVASSEH